jgi:hypothetical protein
MKVMVVTPLACVSRPVHAGGMTISKASVWAATGFIGAGVAGGLTYAAVSTPAVPSSDVDAAVDNATSAAQPAARGLGRRGMLARLEHGQLTLRVKSGDRTVDLQRGTVTAVSPTAISVTSPDKFHGDYTVSSATKVRTGAGLAGISAVHQGDTVLVVATGGKALRILDGR